MLVPTEPKIYHIVHVDRLRSIVAGGRLWCDKEMTTRKETGTTIGINNIKQRRLATTLTSYPDLHVGDCVPFYLCPRSVMLYVIYRANHTELEYQGGQGPIVHLEADLRQTVAAADSAERRWVFTTSNAGSNYFEDYADLNDLNRLDWGAIVATDWRNQREEKQAEFLVEESFPWRLVTRIGVQSRAVHDRVLAVIGGSSHRPAVQIRPDWYY